MMYRDSQQELGLILHTMGTIFVGFNVLELVCQLTASSPSCVHLFNIYIQFLFFRCNKDSDLQFELTFMCLIV